MNHQLIADDIAKRAERQVSAKRSWFIGHKSPKPYDTHVFVSQYRGHTTVYAPSNIPSKSIGQSDASLRAEIRQAESDADNYIEHSSGTRGIVSVFSRKSRMRMIKRLSSMRNIKSAYFVTLTYPGRYLSNPERVKRDMDVLMKRFKRRYTDMGYIWRMELKPRKSGASKGQIAPHYHLIVTGILEDKSKLWDWIVPAWCEITQSGFQYSHNEMRDHRVHGIDIKPVESEKHAMYYVAKYAAKVDHTDYGEMHPYGRHWACGGNLDCEIGLSTRLTRAQWVHLKRLMAAWAKSKGNKHHKRMKKTSPFNGITVFGLGDENKLSTHDNLLIKMLRHARELDTCL